LNVTMPPIFPDAGTLVVDPYGAADRGSGKGLLQQRGDRLVEIGRRKMVDRYTKGALTAIALSLSIIAVQNAVGMSAAQQTPPMKVQICDDLLQCVQLTPVPHDRYVLPTVSTPAPRLLQSK
jgi:hypothetical protein